tara:strand:+ start:203 stop:418 length:216 start_codon:yes stop_codon:yes gene_type:complete
MVNTRLLTIKLTKDQHERIRRNAEVKGKNMSDYIRGLALEHDINVVYKILDIHNKVIKIYEILGNKNAKKS